MMQLAHHLESMKYSPRHNYVIPGLTSWLISDPSPHGCVRMFQCSRDHEEPILPHTHRFDFNCIVLAGKVRNRIWTPWSEGDEYQVSEVTYEGIMGQHQKFPREIKKFTFSENEYTQGDEYEMSSGEYHSIYFRKGTKVLFFEGPSDPDEKSLILEPVVDGEVIPLFRTDPWMFRGEK